MKNENTYHLNFWIDEKLKREIVRKANLYGISLSAMSKMLLVRGLNAGSDKQ